MLLATLGLDLRLQFRARLYSIGIVLAVLFGLAARWLVASRYAPTAAVTLFFVGIGGTTFMFGASMVLLERGERTLQALCTTPLSSGAYLMSKVVTLSTFALVECSIIFLVGFLGNVQPSPLLALGLLATGTLYTLAGIAVVARHDSLTAFIMPDGLVAMLVLQLPFLALFDVGPTWFWSLFPSYGALLLLEGGIASLSWGQWIYAGGSTLVVLCLTSLWARSAVRSRLGIGRRGA